MTNGNTIRTDVMALVHTGKRSAESGAEGKSYTSVDDNVLFNLIRWLRDQGLCSALAQ